MTKNIIDLNEHGNVHMAIRRYSDNGAFYLFRICKLSGDILGIEKLNALPDNWPEEYITELFKNGKVLKSSIF
ncbi:hypothetical protein [Paenibacillus sp. IITD108]|uniref:hypothetical protein n=1 Tax=Paenibacillus sp. IITD108 TaxID=3116649 RepID=UPI002F3FA26B